MLFTNIILVGLAAVATATPKAVKRADGEVAPWEITHFSSRKYSPKSHVAWINITLSDPNEIRLQQVPHGYAILPKFQANCYWTWDYFEDPIPFDIDTVCTPLGIDNIYGNLTMKLHPSGSGELSPGSLYVEITESRTVTALGTEYIRIWEGAIKFSTSDNLKLGCSPSGRCGWNLGDKPVLINQQLTKSVGSCETAEVGGC